MVAVVLREQYRIYCLATKPDQPLMWAHYANSHRGVWLQFATDRLFGDAYQVQYSAEYPEIDLTSRDDAHLVIASLLTTAGGWRDEGEFRLVNKEGGVDGFPDCKDGFVSARKP